MSTKSLTDDEIEKVKKSIDLYEKIIQELGGSSTGNSTSATSTSSTSAASTSPTSTSAAPAASASTSATPSASAAPSASATSGAVSPDGSLTTPDDSTVGPDDSAVPDTSSVTGKKGKKGKKGKASDAVASDTSSSAPAPAPAATAPAATAASTVTYSQGQENIIKDLELDKTIFEKLEKIRKDKDIQPPPDTDGFFGAGAHKFKGSILSGLNKNTGNNVWLKSDGFFVSKNGEKYENQAITSQPAASTNGKFNEVDKIDYYEFEDSALGSLLQQGSKKVEETSKNFRITGGKTLKKRKGRSRKTKRK